MLKQNKLAIAVAMTLGATMGGVSLAQATSSSNVLFFPHVAGGGTIASIVTVVNESPYAKGDYSNGLIHLRLWSKPWTSAASNIATCGEVNEYPATSYNDIVTFDLFNGGLGGVATAFGNDKGIMFENNLTTERVDYSSTATYAIGDTLSLPRRGFLLVDNLTSGDAKGDLAGEMFIFDFGTGASWGYLPYGGEDFKFYGEAGNEVIQGLMPIMPFDEVSTNLMVTPVGESKQDDGKIVTRVSPRQDDSEGFDEVTGGYPKGVIGMYDRDEGAVSTSIKADVVCVGKVNMADLLFGGVDLVPARYTDGGWTYITTEGPSILETLFAGTNATDAAVVYKLEYNTGNTFNGVSVNGVFNNAYELDGGWHQHPGHYNDAK
jgi:hypothetical protein